MKVGPGGLTCATHFTDCGASLDCLSVLDVQGREMAEMGLNAEAVVKDDRDTKATSHPRVDNFSIRWRDDRHSGVTAKVKAFMHSRLARNWVASWAKPTCDPG